MPERPPPDKRPPPNEGTPAPSQQSMRGLDWMNFFVADVQTGFGPFLAVYLAAGGWYQGQIGLALTVAAVAGMASQVPGGALVDWTDNKRGVMVVALGLIVVSGVMLFLSHSFWIVMLAQVAYGCTAGLIGPARSAIGLGLVGHRMLGQRLGRNNRFLGLGTGITAAATGVLAQYVGKRWSFLLAAVLCVPALWAVGRIKPEEIDNTRARGGRPGQTRTERVRFRDLWRNRPLMVFALVLILFQMANASAVPLTAAKMGQEQNSQSALILSGLVLIPQVIMALLATRAATLADSWGRKPLLLIAFVSLTMRIFLFTLVRDPVWLLPLQALSGIEAVVLGLLTPLIVADVTAGTGRYNVAQGAVGIATGLGAAVSTTTVGYIAQWFGYVPALYVLAGTAALALAVIALLMRETRDIPAAAMEPVAA